MKANGLISPQKADELLGDKVSASDFLKAHPELASRIASITDQNGNVILSKAKDLGLITEAEKRELKSKSSLASKEALSI